MKLLLEIDGSYGEGGGQILRSATALSALMNEPVKIKNIRANRPTTGIRPQHHTAISCIKSICKGAAEGLEVGSKNLTFLPGEIQPGEYSFDVGTAGSIILIFQACILACLKSPKPITIKIIGGTDVKWAPTWDYFAQVFLPIIEKMGVKVESELLKRGYYPKGGGEAKIKIYPVKKLKSLKLENPYYSKIEGIVHTSNLPEHISRRMKHSALKVAVKNNIRSYIQVKTEDSFSPGTGITLWCKSDKTVLGSTLLGEKGLSAERVGENAAHQLIKDIKKKATLDSYTFDQILPYMVLAENRSKCIIRELSMHAQTNMWLVNQFFLNKNIFQIDDKQDLKLVKIQGVNYI